MEPSSQRQPTDERKPIPPHTPLTRYYGEDAERERYVADLFNKTAKHYNTVEKLFGNGGLLYRRLSLRRAGLRPGMKVLDVAMGTAAVGRGAARIVGPGGLVVGVDPSQGMLAEAAKVFKGPRVRGYGQALPIKSEHFDFVTMGIALRHVSDLRAAFSEYLRVLKPGGRVWILEGHVPRSPLGQRMTRFVWAKLIPGMTLVATRSREAKELMDYYWDTVDKAVPPETIVSVLGEVGFEDARYQVVVPGAFVEYTGRKPVSPAS
jgi:demethylmenaquinone methyltransferase / 2-methoxy-6-polyprenyl-1,4-benzoquinol methylase